MDEEDTEWMEELTERTRASEAAKRKSEQAALNEFMKEAQHLDMPAPLSPDDSSAAAHAPGSIPAEDVPVAPKRKTSTALDGIIAKKPKSVALPVKPKAAAAASKRVAKPTTKTSATTAASARPSDVAALAMLGAYGSDEDDDEDET